jgi:hypothetical protein
MANLRQIFAEAVQFNQGITRFLKASTYFEYSDLSGLDPDTRDSEQLLLWDELRFITEKLADVQERITYLTRPVAEVSRLRKDTTEKYRTAKGRCYDCRSGIEALVTDEYRDVPYWSQTIVEHDGRDYYLAGFKELPLDGLTVRVRAGS